MDKKKMEVTEIEMFLKYPFMQKEVVDMGWQYSGFIQIEDVDYQVSIQSPDLQTIKFVITPTILNLEGDIENMIKSMEHKNPIQFLEKLEDLIKEKCPKQIVHNHVEIYRNVLNEYAELREFHISIYKGILSRDLREIELTMLDERSRKHQLTIGVNYDVSDNIFYIQKYELPEFHEKHTFESDSSLISLYDKFVSTVENPRMQTFFDFMDEIDRACWVLDPIQPTRKDTYRRISLDENISVVLTYSSLDIKAMPNIRFLGPQKLVTIFEERLNNNFLNWDTSTDDPLQELLILLGILEFPAKPAEDSKEECLLVNTGECCICFSLRLNEKLPEITCPNPSCNQVFHTECLYQWLSSLNPRRFYYEICDKCPNCEKLIHCPIPISQ